MNVSLPPNFLCPVLSLALSLVTIFFIPSSDMVLPESSPIAGGEYECEGLVGGEPGADGAPPACSGS